MAEFLTFVVAALVIVIGAVGVISSRNPVHSAMFLVLAFVTSAVLWLMLEAEFLGIVLVLVGIAYFTIAGRLVLPATNPEGSKQADTLKYFQDVYGLDYVLWEVVGPTDSGLIGKTLQDVEHEWRIRVIAARTRNTSRIGPGGLARDVGFEAGTILGS